MANEGERKTVNDERKLSVSIQQRHYGFTAVLINFLTVILLPSILILVTMLKVLLAPILILVTMLEVWLASILITLIAQIYNLWHASRHLPLIS